MSAMPSVYSTLSAAAVNTTLIAGRFTRAIRANARCPIGKRIRVIRVSKAQFQEHLKPPSAPNATTLCPASLKAAAALSINWGSSWAKMMLAGMKIAARWSGCQFLSEFLTAKER